jgi:hypothetical protein
MEINLCRVIHPPGSSPSNIGCSIFLTDCRNLLRASPCRDFHPVLALFGGSSAFFLTDRFPSYVGPILKHFDIIFVILSCFSRNLVCDASYLSSVPQILDNSLSICPTRASISGVISSSLSFRTCSGCCAVPHLLLVMGIHCCDEKDIQ